MGSYGVRDVEVEAHLSRTAESEFRYYARHGRAYTATSLLSNASSGDTSAVQFSNPADSGTTAVFTLLQLSAASRSYARLYDTFDSGPTGGDALQVQNVRLDAGNGAPDVGSVTATQNPTYTGASTHTAELLPGGQGGNAVGAEMTMPAVLLEPDRRIVIEVEKLASGPDEVSLVPRWYEVPQVFSETNVDPPFDDVIRG